MTENNQEIQNTTTGVAESDNCHLVANLILIFSIILTIIYIVAFGKIETERYSEYAGMIKESSWSFAQIIMGLSITVGGLVWWYLFQKIGSILRHLEKK